MIIHFMAIVAIFRIDERFYRSKGATGDDMASGK